MLSGLLNLIFWFDLQHLRVDLQLGVDLVIFRFEDLLVVLWFENHSLLAGGAALFANWLAFPTIRASAEPALTSFNQSALDAGRLGSLRPRAACTAIFQGIAFPPFRANAIPALAAFEQIAI